MGCSSSDKQFLLREVQATVWCTTPSLGDTDWSYLSHVVPPDEASRTKVAVVFLCNLWEEMGIFTAWFQIPLLCLIFWRWFILSFPLHVVKRELWLSAPRCLKFDYSIRKRVKPVAAICEQTDLCFLIRVSNCFLNFNNSTGSGNLGYSSTASLQLNFDGCTAGWSTLFPFSYSWDTNH